MPKVDATRSEYDELVAPWGLIRDSVDGSRAVKAKGDTYLPRPNPTDKSAENVARYEQYKDRAVFYNVTSRTVAGLSGQVFKKAPRIELPGSIQSLLDDVDGGGVSLLQQSKKVLTDVLAISRAGLFVDYPDTGGAGVTRQQQAEGLIRPSIIYYRGEDIINWRSKRLGGINKVSLIVLHEVVTEDKDTFEQVEIEQWRVLSLDETNQYLMEVWRKDESTNCLLYTSPSPRD